MKEYKMEDVDKVVDILFRLRAMVGTVSYLMNSEGAYHEPPIQHIETWLSDIGDKLNEAIEIL